MVNKNNLHSGSAPSRDQKGKKFNKPPQSMTSPDIARDRKAKDIYRKKMDAARAVGYRESLLMQLNAVVLNWPKENTGGIVGAGGLKAKSALPEAARLLRNVR